MIGIGQRQLDVGARPGGIDPQASLVMFRADP